MRIHSHKIFTKPEMLTAERKKNYNNLHRKKQGKERRKD